MSMIAVDVFSGVGGMSLGAVLAGIDVRLAVEWEPHAAATYARNHTSANVVVQDVTKFERIEVPKSSAGNILFGGPPCQGFSTSNQRTRHCSNLRNWLFMHFVRLADEWKPDWVVFENVKGIVETERGQFLDCVVQMLDNSGYTISHWVLNAVDFGVPQRRSRLFVVGSLRGISLDAPRPTAQTPVTVREAFEGLPPLENGACENWMPYQTDAKNQYAKGRRGDLNACSNHLVTRSAEYIIERYRHVAQGGNWQDIPIGLMANYQDYTRCHTGIYRRLREDSPSAVVGNFRKNMLIHPCQDRGLSVREAARLQSFPDSYEFVGSIGFQQQQVGDAVPPLLAKAVFEWIIKHHLGKAEVSH